MELSKEDYYRLMDEGRDDNHIITGSIPISELKYWQVVYPMYGLNKNWEDVKRFHEAFGHPVKDIPEMLSPDRAGKRFDWLMEEMGEFLYADNITGQADAMIDLIYFALGTLVEMGIRPEPLWNIVQDANMAKLGPDGKPIYGPDNKVKKPDGWVAPDQLLEDEIIRQMENKDETK